MYNWKNLTSIKNGGVEAYALINLLYYEYGGTVTQKLCGTALNSPTKGKKALLILRHYNIVNDKGVFCPDEIDFSIPEMVDENKQWDEVAGLICRDVYGNYQSTKSLLNYTGKLIQKAAEEKRYSIQEFIPIFIKEIKKDSFWSKAITSENFVRKFDTLWTKFGSNIPKRIASGLSDINDIF